MKRLTPFLLVVLVTSSQVSCRRTPSNGSPLRDSAADATRHPSEATQPDPGQERVIIDTVKLRKDPKGGWFSRKLRDVYPQGEDTPIVFCDSGPSFPLQKAVTIFYRDADGKPDASACKAAIAMIEGPGVWRNGRAISLQDLPRVRAQEEHFSHFLSVPLEGGQGQLKPAWRKPAPVGEPCPNSLGDGLQIANRYKGQNCSLVIIYPRDRIFPGTVVFVNWKITGLDGGDYMDPVGPSTHDALQIIAERYGSKYVVSRTEPVLPASIPKPSVPILSEFAAVGTEPPSTRLGVYVSAPVALNAVEAAYSEEARRKRLEGVCLVSLIVDAQGNPQSPRVIKGLGSGLDENAIDAVKRYRFKPAMKGGLTPVPVTITIQVSFRLD